MLLGFTNIVLMAGPGTVRLDVFPNDSKSGAKIISAKTL